MQNQTESNSNWWYMSHPEKHKFHWWSIELTTEERGALMEQYGIKSPPDLDETIRMYDEEHPLETMRNKEPAPPSVKEEDAEGVMQDWNKLSMDNYIEHLEKTFLFDSSGTAKCVFELIAAYKSYAARDYKSAKGMVLPSEQERENKWREMYGLYFSLKESRIEYEKWLIAEIRRLNDPQGDWR